MPTEKQAHGWDTGCPKHGTNPSPEKTLSQSIKVATLSINMELRSDLVFVATLSSRAKGLIFHIPLGLNGHPGIFYLAFQVTSSSVFLSYFKW